MTRFIVLPVLCVSLTWLAGCQTTKPSPDEGPTAAPHSGGAGMDHGGHGESAAPAAAGTAAIGTRAMALMRPTEGSTVSGVVVFEQAADGIRVTGELEGLAPGAHGFHVHQWGDCTAADGTSAGGHFNPMEMPHSGPDAAERHVGDLGNLTADDAGVARYERVDTQLSLSGPASIVGRGLIVHAQSDDLVTQPTGNAGARVACGVIGFEAPATAQ